MNVGGYSASVLGILLVGLVLDCAQPSGDYALADFRLAFGVGQAPLLLVGVAGLLLSRRAVRRRELRVTMLSGPTYEVDLPQVTTR